MSRLATVPTPGSSVRFGFDDGVLFDGFARGTGWNGFDNVAVTPATRDAIARHFFETEAGSGADDDLLALPIGPDGLVDLSDGYATIIEPPIDEESETIPAAVLDRNLRAIAEADDLSVFFTPAPTGRCESGWTGDRCSFPLGHEGDHSNEIAADATIARAVDGDR